MVGECGEDLKLGNPIGLGEDGEELLLQRLVLWLMLRFCACASMLFCCDFYVLLFEALDNQIQTTQLDYLLLLHFILPSHSHTYTGIGLKKLQKVSL